ncbi:alkyl sulfatase dimerization domain-containing protein [Pontixanthobacter gangjinensis]|uniref:MBL fold metallo-hydrolase n=1 Tax=Pontixanthobacter gangjinensis TaxID=1028742 RepID=A0A6I4SKE1_9SPHN|nr:alkyl sulfatase dimerization domain-containing protein [Pontixanthobacter gangjinensis]MXO56331.1 MBL fold metallo-hydrolase [Pontixanthobacter gangjinensis]
MKSATLLFALPFATMMIGNAPPEPGTATEQTADRNKSVAGELPLDDQQDFIDARRGLLAQLDGDILNEDGSLAWKVDEFDFLAGDAPATANPSLWRQSQLAAIHGLFEVAPGLYQVRGYDLSVMTLIAGDTGWIVIDPLLSAAPARASLDLANRTLGERPVVAVLFTHSHGDHFGGVSGVTSAEELRSGEVEIYAPFGFMKETVGESVLAGNAMSRRAQYQFAARVPSGAAGGIGVGLGPKLSTGAIGLLPPTRELSQEAQSIDIDGITFDFIDAGQTEAPAEFVFYLPKFRAFHGAEVVTRTQHNVLTPRGAIVRDTLEWSRKIDEFLTEFGDKSNIMLASHHWPTWGKDAVRQKLRNQRDNYRFIHDQTLRMANQGLTMDEIAEEIGEPDFAASDFGVRGYYGTYEHNAKAVYQRYFGWWNAVPADYDALPKVEEATKWVGALGGGEATLAQGRDAFDKGEYRWAARLLQTLVFAEPANDPAKQWLAATYEQLGFQSEGGTWRNIYLAAAEDLRNPPAEGGVNSVSAQVLAAIPTIDLFDALAARYNPAKMQGAEAMIVFEFADTGEAVTVDMRRSVMFPRNGPSANPAVKLTINRSDMNRLLAQEVTLPGLIGAGTAQADGNIGALGVMFGALDTLTPSFEIVEP